LVEINSAIKPGDKLDLILRSSDDTDDLALLSTAVYDVTSSLEKIIVAQTSPPIPESMIGRNIEVSVLTRTPEFEYRRLGFRAVISKIIPNYQLHGGRESKAIELKRLGKAYERDLRYHFRVQPVPEYPIELALPGENGPLNLIDISVGGLCFSRRMSSESKKIEIGDRLALRVSVNTNERLQLETKVVRKFYKDHFEYIGVKFLDLQRQDKQILQAALHRMQRIKLAKRSGMYYT
jgi:hypothetical protein